MLRTLALSTLLSTAAAQAPLTFTLPYVRGDMTSIGASVVSAQRTATTFALYCEDSDCGLFPAHTLVVGPSTYSEDMSDPNTDFTATQDCVVASASASASAVCAESAGGSEANFPGSSTETYEATDLGSVTVTVTAGFENLSITGSVGEESATASLSSRGSQGTASITPAPGSSTSAAAATSGSGSGSAAAPASTAGAAVNAMVFGGGMVGAAAGVFGGLLL